MVSFSNTIRFIATSPGAVNFVVASAAAGCTTPEQSNVRDGKTYSYYAQSTDGTQWEKGTGSYTVSTHTLTRTSIQSSSDDLITPIAVVFLAPPTVDVFPPPASTLNAAGNSAGYLFRLSISAAGSSSSFSVTDGIAVDSTASAFMRLSSSISKTTGSWVVGNGNGSLDTATILPSTGYHVHIISADTMITGDILTSLSATAPQLPPGYTTFRRIGSLRTDGSSNWVGIIQNGDRFRYTVPILDVINTIFTPTYTNVQLSVPTQVQVEAFGQVFPGLGGSYVWIKDKAGSDPTVSASFFTEETLSPQGYGVGLSSGPSPEVMLRWQQMCDINGQVHIAGNTTVQTYMTLEGYYDRRGRDG